MRPRILYQNLEWVSNETLQLQRMAHEELGLGSWSGTATASSIPITAPGEQLATLDISDKRHPILKRDHSLEIPEKV